jgi:Flp pilus assembly protein TadB
VVTGLVLGAVFGTGVVLVSRGLFPPRPSLAAVFAGAERPRWPADGPGAGSRRSLVARAVAAVAARTEGTAPTADLAMLGQSRERLALERLGLALAVPVLLVVASLVLGVAGSAPPPVLVAVAVAVAVTGGWLVPVAVVRRQAAERRAGFGEALAAYLDLVGIQVASGAGVEQALEDAAAPGDHWAFGLFREASTTARATGVSPWSVLAEFGERYRLAELAELTGSITLAAEAGAPVTETLAAKAAALRVTALADAQGRAEARSEQMALPVVLLLVGFVGLLGYPAVSRLAQI